VGAIANFAVEDDDARRKAASFFFERLARHLLHVEDVSPEQWRSGNGRHPHFDIYDWSLDAAFEVKSASNANKLKLFGDQLDAQLAELEEGPIVEGYEWIFSFRNRVRIPDDGGFLSLLKRVGGDSWESLSAFLSVSLKTAYLIDLRLVDCLRYVHGTSEYARDRKRKRQCVNLNQTDLRELAGNAINVLPTISASPSDVSFWLPPRAERFCSYFVGTEFDGRPIAQFELFPLVSPGFKDRFLRRLNGAVSNVRNG